MKNYCLLVLTDRRSRHQIIRLIPNKTTESVNQALEGILREHRILLMVQNFVVWLKCFLRSISTMRIPTLHGRGERMKITIDWFGDGYQKEPRKRPWKKSLLSKIGLIITLKNAWTTSRRVNFLWVANFNLKFGKLSLGGNLGE